MASYAMSLTWVLLVSSAILTIQGARFYGPQTSVPNMPDAYVRAYTDLASKWTKGAAPSSVGLEFTGKFLSNLDKLPTNDTFFPDLNFLLKAWTRWVEIPRQDAQPFKRILFVWEATGHQPLEVYGKAHFDVHFTFNDAEDWDEMFDYTNQTKGDCIGLNAEGFWRMFQPIPAQCFPGKTHSQLGDVKYGHASHLVAVKTAPEWNPPRLFNETMIFGQWGGEVQFIEPMVSYQWLTSPLVKKKAQWKPTNAPTSYNTVRYYPQKYGYYWKGGNFYVELSAFAKSTECSYDEKEGWAGWFPQDKPLPGPPGLCKAPTPETWDPNSRRRAAKRMHRRMQR